MILFNMCVLIIQLNIDVNVKLGSSLLSCIACRMLFDKCISYSSSPPKAQLSDVHVFLL